MNSGRSQLTVYTNVNIHSDKVEVIDTAKNQVVYTEDSGCIKGQMKMREKITVRSSKLCSDIPGTKVVVDSVYKTVNNV